MPRRSRTRPSPELRALISTRMEEPSCEPPAAAAPPRVRKYTEEQDTLTSASFKIDLWRGRSTSHIVCSGELDVSAAPQLRTAVEAVVQGSSRTLIINGGGLTLLASEGVDVLLGAALLCRDRAMNFEVILNAAGCRTVKLLGASSLLDADQESSRDYEIPREVADALSDVMDQHELYEAFFREPASAVWDKTG